MKEFNFQVKVFLKGSNKPVFERDRYLPVSERVDVDAILKSLRFLYGDSVTIQINFYGI